MVLHRRCLHLSQPEQYVAQEMVSVGQNVGEPGVYAEAFTGILLHWDMVGKWTQPKPVAWSGMMRNSQGGTFRWGACALIASVFTEEGHQIESFADWSKEVEKHAVLSSAASIAHQLFVIMDLPMKYYKMFCDCFGNDPFLPSDKDMAKRIVAATSNIAVQAVAKPKPGTDRSTNSRQSTGMKRVANAILTDRIREAFEFICTEKSISMDAILPDTDKLVFVEPIVVPMTQVPATVTPRTADTTVPATQEEQQPIKAGDASRSGSADKQQHAT